MANGPLALSGIDAGPPQEAEYEAVYAAVTATERGRWFLTEFAKRNRHADTCSLITALKRIEAAVGANSQSEEEAPTSDSPTAAKKIQEIAFQPRERGADPALGYALDGAAREACAISGNGLDDRTCGRPPESPSSVDFEFELQDREKFATAAAALAAALGTLGEQAAPDEPPLSASAERSISAATVMPHDYADIAAPAPPPEPMASNPRWYIEPPDFVFHSARSADGATVASSNDVAEPHSLLPGAQLLPNPEEDPAELFEPSANILTMSASAAVPVAAPEPAPSATTTEIPPIRSSAAPQVRAGARAAPIDPLAALRALTEDELVALFG